MANNIVNREQAIQLTWFLLRVVIGLMFIQHGGMKLFGWMGGMPPLGTSAKIMTEPWIGGVIEFFGGITVLLGLFTRPAAFILSGEMAVAYWQFHAPNGTWPIENHGEPAVLYCFIFLFMSAYGAGIWSIDALFKRNRPSSQQTHKNVALTH